MGCFKQYSGMIFAMAVVLAVAPAVAQNSGYKGLIAPQKQNPARSQNSTTPYSGYQGLIAPRGQVQKQLAPVPSPGQRIGETQTQTQTQAAGRSIVVQPQQQKPPEAVAVAAAPPQSIKTKDVVDTQARLNKFAATNPALRRFLDDRAQFAAERGAVTLEKLANLKETVYLDVPEEAQRFYAGLHPLERRVYPRLDAVMTALKSERFKNLPPAEKKALSAQVQDGLNAYADLIAAANLSRNMPAARSIAATQRQGLIERTRAQYEALEKSAREARLVASEVAKAI